MVENNKNFNEHVTASLHSSQQPVCYLNPSQAEHLAQDYQVHLQLFRCQYPANLHMQNLPVKVATFYQGWDAHRVHATPRQIAEAGFFFLGFHDRVKC